MNAAEFFNLRPGDVVSTGTTRAVVVTGPLATRQGFRVELRIGRARRFINQHTAQEWKSDAENIAERGGPKSSRPDTKFAPPEEEEWETRRATRGKRNAEHKETENPLLSLSRFRLSAAELAQLKKEVDAARAFIRRSVDAEGQDYETKRSELESQKHRIYEQVKSRFEKELVRLHDEWRAAFERSNSIGLARSLFTSDKKRADERAELLSNQIEQTKAAMRSEVGTRLEPVEKQLRRLQSVHAGDPWKRWFERWREQADTPVLRKTIRREGRQLVLKNILPVLDEGIDAKIDLLIAKRKRKDRWSDLQVKAAVSSEEIRALAESVKKDILSQFLLLKGCPYCGGPLDRETAHADHIYPVSKGGQSTKSNMVYVCVQCNLKKKDKTLAQFANQMGFGRSAIEARLELLGKDF